MSVLTSQLQGVMDCSDMISLSHILKSKRLEKLHRARLNKLLCIYFKTNNYFIDKYNKLVVIPNNFEKLITESLASDEEKKLCWEMLSRWVTWAESASELYKELMGEDLESKKWWGYLYNLHKLDLKEAKYYKQKLMPEGYDEPIKQPATPIKINTVKSANTTE